MAPAANHGDQAKRCCTSRVAWAKVATATAAATTEAAQALLITMPEALLVTAMLEAAKGAEDRVRAAEAK